MAGPFVFEAGRLELDFVNTRVRSARRVVDRLGTPEDLVAWLHASGLVPTGGYVATPNDPGALERARILRGRIEAYARAAVDATAEPPAAMRRDAAHAIDAFLAARPVVRRLRETEKHHAFALDNEPLGHTIDDHLIPVAESAAELVTRLDPTRIRACKHPDCILYFYDATRNRSRRWCSMRTCGNRAKVAAYRTRHG